MNLAEIITFLIALPAIIIGAIVLIINWWIEGKVTDSLLEAFDINPIIGLLLLIAGIIGLIAGIMMLVKR